MITLTLRKYVTDREDVAMLDWTDLTDAERATLDAPDDDDIGTYFRYRSSVYSLADAIRGNFGRDRSRPDRDAIAGIGETVFSAVLVFGIDYADDTISVGYWSE